MSGAEENGIGLCQELKRIVRIVLCQELRSTVRIVLAAPVY